MGNLSEPLETIEAIDNLLATQPSEVAVALMAWKESYMHYAVRDGTASQVSVRRDDAYDTVLRQLTAYIKVRDAYASGGYPLLLLMKKHELIDANNVSVEVSSTLEPGNFWESLRRARSTQVKRDNQFLETINSINKGNR